MHPHVRKRKKGNWPVESSRKEQRQLAGRIWGRYDSKSDSCIWEKIQSIPWTYWKKKLRRKGIRSWNLRLRRHLGAATVGRESDCSSAAALPSRRLSHPRPWTRPGPVCPPRPALRRSELPLHRDCAKPVPRLRSNRPCDKPSVTSAPVTHRRSFRTRI